MDHVWLWTSDIVREWLRYIINHHDRSFEDKVSTHDLVPSPLKGEQTAEMYSPVEGYIDMRLNSAALCLHYLKAATTDEHWHEIQWHWMVLNDVQMLNDLNYTLLFLERLERHCDIPPDWAKPKLGEMLLKAAGWPRWSATHRAIVTCNTSVPCRSAIKCHCHVDFYPTRPSHQGPAMSPQGLAPSTAPPEFLLNLSGFQYGSIWFNVVSMDSL